MLKTLAAATLATLVAFAPMVASAQVKITPTASQPAHQVIQAATPPKPPTAEPKLAETPKDKALVCSREAAAKGLQGKPRKAFLAKCRKAGAAERSA
jgi:psiF repeat